MVDSVNNYSSTSATNSNAISAANSSVNISDATEMENNFISLMVAQIQNQDPTDPLDSTEFLDQFSAMSQVKSMENMASMQQSNLILLDNLQTLTAANLVGQEVKVAVAQVNLGTAKVSGQLQLNFNAGASELTLTDSNGKATTIALGDHAAGTVPFSFDPKALGLAPGKYQISASTDAGEAPTVEVAGGVTQVRVSSQGPLLEIAGVGTVPFYQIIEFSQPALADLL